VPGGELYLKLEKIEESSFLAKQWPDFGSAMALLR